MMGEKVSASWVPLMDYAVLKGVSVSTLRRRIKSNKVRYKLENGRYLIWNDSSDDDSENQDSAASISNTESEELKMRLANLESDLKKANEEIAELKMLVALYEEQIPQGLDS